MSELEDTVEKESGNVVTDTAVAGAFAITRPLGRAVRDSLLLDIPLNLQYQPVAVVLETAVGRPYGKFRNYLLKKFNATKGWRKAVVDCVANGTFYALPRAVYLAATGEDADKIATSCGLSLATSSVVIGPLYGLCLDGFRKLFSQKKVAQ